MSARPITLVLGTAAGALLAAGLIPLATIPVANADEGDAISLAGLADPASFDPALIIPAPDSGFISATDPLLAMLGITDIGAANPGQDFEAMILQIPSLGITDVLTSGNEATNDLAQFGVAEAIGLGTAGITVNTFIDTMNPALDSTFNIPFEDPLAGLWDVLVANDFFGL
ncbi:MAG TPA: hypothetical protein VE908_08330 [Mycobacterium sp.]|jgi:ABC-type transport system substrate-binding protein|nr:hypothetical protein [Mycobacterium sp.]